MAATDWANLTVAGAFVTGAIAGAIGTIRVMRHVLGYVRGHDVGRDDPPDHAR